MSAIHWDERYAEIGFAYGTVPNHYLESVYEQIPTGEILMLGDGEGRNGVFLSEKGYSVHSVDYSKVGLEKAAALAQSRKTTIQTIHCDLEHFKFEEERWNGVVSIFCHTPPKLRNDLHRGVARGLKKNGVFVLEAYSPRQIEFNTGGPKNQDLLMNLEEIRSELQGLSIELSREIEREVIEGKYHTGKASVIQLIARKVSHD